jgi:peptide methionine sulfoxide reductase MsrB
MDEFQKLRDRQNDLCAICGKPETQKGRRLLSVDHCHKTNKVRALLCKHCNSALGHLHDDPELARKAHEYLMRHSNA